MNNKHLTTKIGGAVLTSLLLLGVVAVGAASAQAQGRGDRNRDRQERRDSNRNAGNRDGERNRDRNWNGNRDRRVSRAPNVVIVPRVYRQQRVYSNRRNNGYYGNNGYGGYGAAAQSQGYQAGYYTGQNDARRGQSYNPQRSHYYKDERGNSAYLNGFLRGYADGWRSAGGRGRGYGW